MDSTSSGESLLPSVEQKMYFQFALQNEKIENLITYLQTGSFVVGLTRNQQTVIKRQASLYTWDSMKQVLYYLGSRDGKKKVVIRDPDQLTRVFHLYHGNGTGGHSGWRGTYEKISQRYFWHGIKEDIRHYVARCKRCQRFTPFKTMAREVKPIKVKSPLEMTGMSLIEKDETATKDTHDEEDK
ncbi:hypothetical protein O3P69_020202 [Scylla paramamosain]|uniref:Integrase zinc-binding domain-containing protein n=1 Tax=Scylla paramamosain TaxID=85552 RepID=A0AAW0TL36_SCYPA